MNLFDILGPVMVGPSSSHTAGAVRLGRTARRLLGEGTPREAAITLFGSFAATGHGHGTDRALIAGLLGFQPDDERIARSFDIARDACMAFSFTLSRAGRRASEHGAHRPRRPKRQNAVDDRLFAGRRAHQVVERRPARQLFRRFADIDRAKRRSARPRQRSDQHAGAQRA